MVMGFSICEQHNILTPMPLNLSRQSLYCSQSKEPLSHKTEQGLQFLCLFLAIDFVDRKIQKQFHFSSVIRKIVLFAFF